MTSEIQTTPYPRWMIQWFELGCVATVIGLPLLIVAPLAGSLFVAVGTFSIAGALFSGQNHDAMKEQR